MATNRRDTSKSDMVIHENKLSSGRQRRRRRMKAKRTQRTLIRKVAANMPRDERGEVRYLAGTGANGARQVNLPRNVRRQRGGRDDSEENTHPDHVATLADVTLVVSEDFTQTSVVNSTILGVQKLRNNSWHDVNKKEGTLGGVGVGRTCVGGNADAESGEGVKEDLDTEVSEVRRQIMLLLGEGCAGERPSMPEVLGGDVKTNDRDQAPAEPMAEPIAEPTEHVQATSQETTDPSATTSSSLEAQEQAAAALAAMMKLKFVPKT